MVTAADFIAKVKIPLNEHWGYIYGQWGATWTRAKQDRETREMTVKYGSKWIGRRVTDCSGLLRWALNELGESIAHHARYQYTEYSAPKGKLINGRRDDGNPILPGTAVFLQGSESKIHHVGVYIGNDTVIEAKGTIYGVVTSHLAHWDHWGELKMVDYTNAAELETGDAQTDEEDAEAGTVVYAVVNNPNTWLNVRSGMGGEFPVQFQVQKGTQVEVLDAGEPEYWKIRHEGRVGWAAAKYLKIVEQPKEEAPTYAPAVTPESVLDTDVPQNIVSPEWGDVMECLEQLAMALNETADKLRSMITVG